MRQDSSAPRQKAGHPNPGGSRLLPVRGQVLSPMDLSDFIQQMGGGGLDWKMTKDTRSCKPTTDGHFPSFGRESKIVAHFLEGSDIHIL